MRHGDISNRVVPPFAIVFEHLVATPPPTAPPGQRANLWGSRTTWRGWIYDHEVIPDVINQTRHLRAVLETRAVLATFYPPEAVEPLKELVHDHDWPFIRVFSTTPNQLPQGNFLRIYHHPSVTVLAPFGKATTITEPARTSQWL